MKLFIEFLLAYIPNIIYALAQQRSTKLDVSTARQWLKKII